MKSLGIVRKIDDLGRVVIPKEVRKTNGWGPGTPLELFTDGDKVVFQSFLGERDKAEAIERLQNVIKVSNNPFIVSDLEQVISYLKGENE